MGNIVCYAPVWMDFIHIWHILNHWKVCRTKIFKVNFWHYIFWYPFFPWLNLYQIDFIHVKHIFIILIIWKCFNVVSWHHSNGFILILLWWQIIYVFTVDIMKVICVISCFQCTGYDYMAYMDYMDPNICCPKKAVKLNHSLTHCILKFWPNLWNYVLHFTSCWNMEDRHNIATK